MTRISSVLVFRQWTLKRERRESAGRATVAACSIEQGEHLERSQDNINAFGTFENHFGEGEMADLKGSQTEKNLIASFAGEAQASTRYTYFASQAKKDGFVQISKIFEETAHHEIQHAKRFFKQLQGGDVVVQAPYPAGIIAGTAENLRAAATGEHHEWAELYPGFAEIARKEGFEDAAKIWEAVCVSEKQHERRYLGLLTNVEANKVFIKDQPVVWRCLNCGYLHEGLEAPEECPACAHPRAHFELLAENW